MVITSKRSKFRESFLRQTYYFGLLIGIVSLKFNFKTRKFSHSRFLRIYVTVCNILIIFTSPVLAVKSFTELTFFADNSQMKLLNSISANIQSCMVIMTLLFRSRRECRLRRIMEDFIKLEWDYFERVSYPERLLKPFDRLFLLKYLGIWNQSLSFIYIVFRFMKFTSGWWYGVSFFYVVTMLNILHGVVMHYFISLLYIGSRFRILNYRLNEIFHTLRIVYTWTSRRAQRQMQRALAAEVEQIIHVHCQLRNITHKLNNVFKFQMLTALCTQLFNFAVMGYYGAMVTLDISKFNVDYISICLFSVTYWSMILDMHWVDVICHIVQTAYEETRAILQKYNEFDELEEMLAKSCDLLSLHLMHENLAINISGMFNLNKHTSFVMFGFTLRHVIILVQNDLANTARFIKEQRQIGKALQIAFSSLQLILENDEKES